MTAGEALDFISDLTERLAAALSGESVDTDAAHEVGARLVAGGFIGEHSLARTFSVLGNALPAATGDAPGNPQCGRIIELLGALASGYTRALSLAWQGVERDLRTSEARFRAMFESSPMGIAISAPDGWIIETNRALDDILGYCPGDLAGRDLTDLFSPGDRPIAEEHHRGLVTGRDPRLRVRVALRRADGEAVWVYLDGVVLRDTDGSPLHVITMAEDITNMRLLEQQLKHQTLHDLQTGLPNRQYFLTHLEQVLARAEPSAIVTLLHLDLDGFTAVNDGLGRQAGDLALDVAARRLAGVVADRSSMVARLSADEFAILIEPGDAALNISDLIETINTELAEPFYIDDTGVALTATVGVVQRRADQCSPQELMRAASTTLRRIRGRSKRQWVLFDAQEDAADRAQLRLAAAMPGALETGQLEVTYQPVVTLAGQQVMGVEAALLWQHPDLGMLTSSQCMQAAELTGVVHEVGQWLLHTAAQQAMCWRHRFGAEVPPMVVNLMPSQAQDPDLVAKIRAVLTETGLPAGRLEIRAPVSAIRTVIGDFADGGGGQAEDNLRVLTELGVRAGLYDFAGGIGELRCVAELPVCTVRIAEPISEQVAEDPSRILSQAAQALVHTVRGAGIDVVAYPVNNADQAACWPWIGANWAVGALFGAPGPPQHVAALLNRQHQKV
ncbi:MAG: EAL domain-containing protein [Pseudonocardiales bacterium]|nr:EAL domain-containing protein [Pseudonocardiales bacterium]MBV9652514.1 EAL domain-containing protein [Pseudonocardiales bacterium]